MSTELVQRSRILTFIVVHVLYTVRVSIMPTTASILLRNRLTCEFFFGCCLWLRIYLLFLLSSLYYYFVLEVVVASEIDAYQVK